MVLIVLDRLRGEKVVEFVPVGGFLGPFSDSFEHEALDFDSFVTRGWVMEGAENVVAYFLDRDAGVLPRINDARNNILKNSNRHATGARVEDVGEVIFGEHGVGRVIAAGVGPGLELLGR